MSGPTVKREHGVQLWRILHESPEPRKARQIHMPSRMIRAVCAEWPQHFMSTQRGYQLVATATDGEIEEAIADLRSRVDHLNRRASALEDTLRRRRQRSLV